jgi:hypothetical protein
MHDTSAALRRVATDMCASKAKIFAQEMNQKRSVFGTAADPFSVHDKRNLRHASSLGITLVIMLPMRLWRSAMRYSYTAQRAKNTRVLIVLSVMEKPKIMGLSAPLPKCGLKATMPSTLACQTA